MARGVKLPGHPALPSAHSAGPTGVRPLGVSCQAGSCPIGRAIGEIRPLLAGRGFAVPHRPGLRLRTLAGVFACAEAGNVKLCIGGTGTRVRRPKAGRPGRAAVVCGTRKQNTVTTTTISAGQGPRPVVRGGAAGPDARPARDARRGHHWTAPALPARESRGRHRLPGTGQRFPAR
jgi:hypothetical protein